jgi:hypothetical protein
MPPQIRTFTSAGILAGLPKRHPRRIRRAAHAKGDADMPSQAMQDVIDAFRDRQKASAGQPTPTLAPQGGTVPLSGPSRLHRAAAGG